MLLLSNITNVIWENEVNNKGKFKAVCRFFQMGFLEINVSPSLIFTRNKMHIAHCANRNFRKHNGTENRFTVLWKEELNKTKWLHYLNVDRVYYSNEHRRQTISFHKK